uniref:AAA family ATPase n=1 Tax=uncultured Roseibium sp. TaxID=1936171 RepID=UPI0032180903
GGKTHKMEPLFMVMATQNPVEQEGTYPLPEAQMDRFLMHVLITYPPVEDEVEVIRLVRGEEIAALEPPPDVGNANATSEAPGNAPIPQQAVFEARREIGAIHVSEAMERYMADLVNATRFPDGYGDDLKRWIEIGASPRASLALDKCGRTHAWLAGRDYVDPEDVRAIVPDVLRHRLGLTFEAQGEGIGPDHVVAELTAQVALP